MKRQYEVGYKSPPRHSQFKKGKSGNPLGRPKSRPSLNDLLQKELASKITITEGGQPVQVTKQEAMIKQLVNSGIKGDPKALKLIMPFLEANPALAESDFEELTRYLEEQK